MRRLTQLLISVAIIFIISRALIRSLPGDPLDSLLAETALTIPRDRIAEDLGLNRPFIEACWIDFVRLLRGDLGYSLITREPVLPLLLSKLSNTLSLAFGALALSLSIAIPLGIFCAFPVQSKKSRAAARLARVSATLLTTIPVAWAGPVMLYVFAVFLPWTDYRGSLPLACLTLSLPLAGSWARIIELRVREEMGQPYFKAALARGLSPTRAILKSAFAPAAGALLAVLGSQVGSLLAGSFVAEWVFDWPGMGVAWVQATLQRDYPVMEGATLFGAITCLVGVFIGDSLQKLWDPRQRVEASS